VLDRDAKSPREEFQARAHQSAGSRRLSGRIFPTVPFWERDMQFAKEAQSHNDRTVASAQGEVRRLLRNGNSLQPEAASSISSGLSIVGKIIGHGALTIFGCVRGEVRASNVVIAEGAQIEGGVVAEELTVGGYVKGAIHANRVKLTSTGVVEGDIFHRILAIEENARFEGMSRRSENAIETPSRVQID
jgi:cytoskeletal protein CcmA (bactofilin family)